jgi:hypothetical protein
MLGRQQRLILLVEKDQQVLLMGKTFKNNNNNKEKYLYPYALRGCVRPLRIVPLNNLCCAARPFLIAPLFTIFKIDYNTFRLGWPCCYDRFKDQ